MKFLTVAAMALSALLVSLSSHADDRLAVATAFYAELDGNGPLSRVADLIADDYIDHNRSPQVPAEVSDKLGIMGLFEQLRSGFSDMKHAVELLEPFGENRVVAYWTFTGTHDGMFFGIPASNNTITIAGIDLLEIENGQITQHWHVEELMALFQQLSGQP